MPDPARDNRRDGKGKGVIGQTLSHYRIERRLGAGGMGEVSGICRAGGDAAAFDEGLELFRARSGHDFSFMWVCTDGVTLLELARAAAAIGRASEASDLFQQARAAGTPEALAVPGP